MLLAVVGNTGFVGSTLMRSMPDARGFNSHTIGNAEGMQFDLLYCAAAPGSMQEANRFPERDEARIEALIKSLRQIRAERIVLISTIAVLEDFGPGQDEETSAFQSDIGYGRNRRRLEEAIAEHFERCLIIRLPALFGPGLSKNFIFDLLNPVPSMLTAGRYEKAKALPDVGRLVAGFYSWAPELEMYKVDRPTLAASPERAVMEIAFAEAGLSAVGFHNRNTTYQFYNLENLVADCDRALVAGIECLHLAPEPVSAARVHEALNGLPMPETGARVHTEDMRTRHGRLWWRDDGYISSAETVLSDLASFFAAERVKE